MILNNWRVNFHSNSHKIIKIFLLSNNGRVFVNNENIYINAIEDSINIDVLFGHKCDEENMNISSYMDLFEGDLMENTLIIGDTFNNGFIVLVCGGKDMGVYYWDHSYEYEISNDDGNMYFITKTFGEF